MTVKARQRKLRIAGITVACLLTAGIAFQLAATDSSTAAFDATLTRESNAFTMGTVSFDVKDGQDTAYTPIDAEVTDLQPGGSFYKSILVKNTGTLQLRYTATSTPTEFSSKATDGTQDGVQLSKDITVDLRKVASDSSCNEAGWNSGTEVAGSGSFGGVTPAVNTEVPFIGDKAPGAQAGDRVLDAGTSEVLCVRSSISLDAENDIQGAKAVYTLGFFAEQTANN